MMIEAAFCQTEEFSRVSAAVAAAIDSEGRPSKGCLIMVGLTIVAGVISSLDSASRQEIMTCISGMVDSHGGQGVADTG